MSPVFLISTTVDLLIMYMAMMYNFHIVSALGGSRRGMRRNGWDILYDV